MAQVWIVMYGSEVVALVVAALVVLVVRSRSGAVRLPGAVRAWAVAGIGLAAVLLVAWDAMMTPMVPTPLAISRLSRDVHYAVPLIAGLLATAALMLPVRRRTQKGTAVLAPRHAGTYVRPWWLVVAGTVLAVLLVVTVAAGLVSQPDDQGRWARYVIDHGAWAVGTSIYGWYYSVPCLVLIAALLALAWLDLRTISRPALGADAGADTAVRRWRSRGVVAVVAGALLLRLAVVLWSIAGALGLEGSGPRPSGDIEIFRSTFAPLAEPLRQAGRVASACGWFLWFAVLLSALAARRPTSVSDAADARVTAGG